MTDAIHTTMALPLAPISNERYPPYNGRRHTEMEVYVQFMRHLRQIPHVDMTVKILSAIQFTADSLNLGDDYVAKLLVDCGLKAPRRAFPQRYLRHIDKQDRHQDRQQAIDFNAENTLKILSKLGNVSDFVSDRA